MILNYFPIDKTPRPQQSDILKAVEEWWSKTDVFVITAPTGTGKCHRLGQGIIMADGSTKKIEDIQIGDKVIGPDSSPRTVTNTCRGKEKLFTVIPKRQNGNPFTVTGNHILPVRVYSSTSLNGTQVPIVLEKQIKAKDWQYLSKTQKHCSKLWKPDNLQIATPDTPITIPPYILGVWLGDGNSSTAAITTMDKEIEEEWTKYSLSLGCTIRKETKEDHKASTYYSKTDRGHSNPFLNLLKDLDLVNNKHIPDRYLYGSLEERLELIAGLSDTDGSWDSGSKSFEIIQVNQKLSNQILFLLRSVGFSVSQSIKVINNKEYYRIVGSTCFAESIPVRVKRKQPVSAASDWKNTGFKVVEEGVEEYAGIEVDGDHLYLLEDFTVTHNSAISVTLSRYIKNKYRRESVILTPNNMLSEQYAMDYPSIPVAYGLDYCKCSSKEFTTCKQRREFAELPINKQKRMPKFCKQCPYKKSQTRHNILRYPFTYITNYHKYVSLKRTSEGKSEREYLIIDEAHLLVDTIKEYNKAKIWEHDFPYNDYPSRVELLEGLHNTQLDPEGNNVFQKAIDMLEMIPPRYILKEETGKYYGEPANQLQFNPITSKGLDNPIITGGTKKTFLLSATINYKDIEELGLDGKRVTYIDSDSCIPASSRPIISLGTAKVTGKDLESTAEVLCEEIQKIADFHSDSKGLVHATYAQAKVLKTLLQNNPRFKFHTNKNKQAIYTEFREATDNSILVASGMYEGIDLPYEAGRFQIVAKIPFPNLGEPAVKYQTEQDEKWYQWQAVKTILQAGGRICRTPTDYGVTYVLDKNFNRLYSRNPDLFPLWFREAVEIRETSNGRHR